MDAASLCGVAGKRAWSQCLRKRDAAPGGSWFDLAHGPAMNDRGDIAFTAHVYADGPCAWPCDSLYVKRSPSGNIESIAHHGDPSPVARKNYNSAYGATLNSRGDVAFQADLSAAADGSEVAVFVYTQGTRVTIAKPGDAMPGGGILATTGFFSHDAYINNRGDVVFVGTLASGENGLYISRQGVLQLVAKTGTTTGAATISTMDDFGGGVGNTQVAINDAGQIIFAAKFKEGGGGLLVATPK